MKKQLDRTLIALVGRTAVLGPLLACHGAGPPPHGASDAHGQGAPSASTASAHGGHHHPGDAGGHEHQHRFDDAARWSKVFDDAARDAWQRPAVVVKQMEIGPGMSVADVGAGTGYFEPYLARAVGAHGSVVAEDIEAGMVSWIEARARREGLSNVTARQGAGDDPRLGTASFDRILVVDTWHHVDARPRFAKKLAEALKPGGAVFIVDFTLESPHGPPQAARLSPAQVAQDLASAGLSTEVVEGPGLPLPFQYIVRGTLR